MQCRIIGAPVHEGSGRLGCEMGPDAFRAAGLAEALRELGHGVTEMGKLKPPKVKRVRSPSKALKSLPAVVAWTECLHDAVFAASADAMPIVLGGDHSIAAGILPALARRAAAAGRPLFVLWLDAHSDCHTLATTSSGHLHGVPLAYAIGEPGFAGVYPPLTHPVEPRNVCMLGIRSVDPAEKALLKRRDITVHDMPAIDEHGVAPLLRAFLSRVKAAGGMLHVSLDVDFLEPTIAPAVGTTVPGGATFREAHLVMEMLHDSGLVTSLDLVELNPFLDERGRTALLLVDLVASLMGRRILDRPTRSFG